ncbi:hypothetical protein HY68_36735 [Streptomyces sp. AcH 505]|uniref:SLOG family protein n=1 Tax=Streptomyces sp. AcH 505 TaxID=352211 RepID=UPI000591A060|nr:hypothetical protein HY68_36735 [Streptomyces sp. AcH 505]
MNLPPNYARILITGPRTLTDTQLVANTLLQTWHDAIQDGYDGILITHGTAEGADDLSDQWALSNGIPRDPHPSDWEGPCSPQCPPGHRRPRAGRDYCPTAGHRRNQHMVDLQPRLCVAFIRPCTRATCRKPQPHDSHGTADCIRRAKKAGLPVLRVLA